MTQSVFLFFVQAKKRNKRNASENTKSKSVPIAIGITAQGQRVPNPTDLYFAHVFGFPPSWVLKYALESWSTSRVLNKPGLTDDLKTNPRQHRRSDGGITVLDLWSNGHSGNLNDCLEKIRTTGGHSL